MIIEANIINQIFAVVKSQLYIDMRFLDVALNSFHYYPSNTVEVAATDGLTLFYHKEQLGKLYYQDSVMVNRLYLHIVLHCIFRHMVRPKREQEVLWKLACDIAVEEVIDALSVKSVRQSSNWLRTETYRKLHLNNQVLTPEIIYRNIEEWRLCERDLLLLQQEFCRDDHQLWPEDDSPQKSQTENKWQDISEKAETEMETFANEAASDAGRLLGQLKVENRQKYDYRSFLQKFSVLREEMKIDEDSFDYGFYSYGLSLYGNMPLIEPQEWKESKKIEEFVIVIDTSMSCSGELIKDFLAETYSVLKQNDSFFSKTNIHIIQCDEQVQNDKKIENKKDLEIYMENLELRGEGGTDFRPAFEHVAMLLSTGELNHLKGLLYFTDGQGIYPSRRPPYETAFVFVAEGYQEATVPPWALKVVLDEAELRGVINSEY